MELHDFIDACREVLIRKGNVSDSRLCGGYSTQVATGRNISAYADENIAIFMSQDNASAEIIIGKGVQPDKVENTAIMIAEDGQIFRRHGEWTYLIPVVETLLAE